MWSKSYQKQEIKRSGSGISKFFIRNTFNIRSVCIIICHLTLFGTISPGITSLIDIVLNVYLLLRTELELERRRGVGS